MNSGAAQCPLPDPDLVEQRPVEGGCLVVVDPGGDEHGACLVEQRCPGSLIGDDPVDPRPQAPGSCRVGELAGNAAAKIRGAYERPGGVADAPAAA